jgi:hypothetical protein
MGYKMESDFLNKVSPKMRAIIQTSIIEDKNILTGIDSIFTQHSKYAPDILILMSKDLGVVVKEPEGEKTFVSSIDFLPINGLSRYKLDRAQGSFQLSTSTPNDEDNEEWDFDLEFEWRLNANVTNLREQIILKFPSLDIWLDKETPNPIFCAISRQGEYCNILGIYQRGNLGHYDDERDVDAMREGVHLVAGVLHETACSMSKFNVTVHSSIVDQVKNEDPSIPVAFIDRYNGALQHPICIRFSEKVSQEMGVMSDIEYCIFRDDEHLFISVSAPKRETQICRIYFENLKPRINKKKINTALRKGLGLKRDRTGISKSTLQRTITEDKISGREEVFSRIGLGLKMATMMTDFGSPKSGMNKGKWRMDINHENAQFFDRMIPLLIHLCLARLDPNLRGEIRRMNTSRRRKISGRKGVQHVRNLVWGNDQIRYVGEGNDSTVSKHWCNSHVRRIIIKKSDTIRSYKKQGFPVEKENNETVGYRIIRGHYRGLGDVIEWDGNYRFGKRPSYYSAVSLRWLSWIEKMQNIDIQHAEKGGELRIPLSNGYIQVDGWCKENNTIYEFHGDVYHGNPLIFAEDEICHPHDRVVTAGELYRKTMDREELIRSLGFNLVSIWETEWKDFEKNL